MLIKKGDKIVAIVIVLFLLIFSLGKQISKDDKNLALIEINGEEYKTIVLSSDMEKEEIFVKINKDRSFRIIAEKGRIKMAESTCPNNICVNTGWISQRGENIICLPYKTAIYIEKIRGDDN